MSGPELATLSTIGWVILTLAFLIVVGTWSTGESWTILPGIVRGVHDWATEDAVNRRPASPSPWAVTSPEPTLDRGPGSASFEPGDGAEIEELGLRHIS